jgi:hypothetical protein
VLVVTYYVAMNMRGGREYAREQGVRHAWPGPAPREWWEEDTASVVWTEISEKVTRGSRPARCGVKVRLLTLEVFDASNVRDCERCIRRLYTRDGRRL